MIGHDAATLIPAYVRGGLRVLPLHAPLNGRCSCGRDCATPGKHPRLRHGAKDASDDLGQVAEWLARWPGDEANWGVVPAPGVIVVDIDPRNGGHDSLADLEARHNPLPSTLRATTGSGGEHVWFTMSGAVKGKLAQGIDVKTQSGYVVAPPSRHMAGGRYHWTNTAAAVPAPRWLRLLLTPAPPSVPRTSKFPVSFECQIAGLIRFVLGAPVGERNGRLYWAACRAHESGLDTTPLVDAAESIGLSRFEAEGTVQSAERAPARAGR